MKRVRRLSEETWRTWFMNDVSGNTFGAGYAGALDYDELGVAATVT